MSISRIGVLDIFDNEIAVAFEQLFLPVGCNSYKMDARHLHFSGLHLDFEGLQTDENPLSF